MLPPLYSEGSQSYSRSRSSSASTASDVSTRADSIFPYKDELEHPERMSRVSGRDQYPPNLGLKDVSTEVDRYSDGLEDEEEQVGLMQRDRDWQRGQGSAKVSKRPCLAIVTSLGYLHFGEGLCAVSQELAVNESVRVFLATITLPPLKGTKRETSGIM